MKKHTLKALALVAAIGAISTTVQADVGKTSAYAEGATATSVWKNSFGDCWRTGTWTKEQATVEGCDGYTKAAPAPAPVAAKPAPAPQPTPKPAAAAPAAPAAPKVFILKGDVLFDLGKANLKPAGVAALSKLYNELTAVKAKYSTMTVKGFTDRLGSDAYNQKLSEARAKTVAAFMVGKGFRQEGVSSVGLGKAKPVTENTCDKVANRAKLVECLAPDRRVEIEVDGTK